VKRSDYLSDVYLRRLVSLLTAAFMLHLNFVAVDAACVEHPGGGGAGMGTAHQHASMHEHGSSSAGVERTVKLGDACQTPTQTECCHAMASCSTIGVASAVQTSRSPIAAPTIIACATETMLSRAIAPDPPPPKA
jgi:hypothetical protein